MDEHIQKKLAHAKDGSDFFKQVHYVAEMMDKMSDKALVAAWNKFPPKAWRMYDNDYLYVLARMDLAGLDGFLCAQRRARRRGASRAPITSTRRASRRSSRTRSRTPSAPR
jgi:hypothetical protein